MKELLESLSNMPGRGTVGVKLSTNQQINEQVAASRFSSTKQKHFEDCSHRIEEEPDSEKTKPQICNSHIFWFA